MLFVEIDQLGFGESSEISNSGAIGDAGESKSGGEFHAENFVGFIFLWFFLYFRAVLNNWFEEDFGSLFL